MERDCPFCEQDVLIPNEETWGGDFDCPKCGKHVRVEWDYIDSGSHYFALVPDEDTATE